MNSQTFEITHTHASNALANSQEVVRFLDTKASILTGLTTAVSALPFIVLDWLAGRAPELPLSLKTLTKSSPAITEWCGWICVVGLIAGGGSLISAVLALRARSNKNREATILFPYSDPRDTVSGAKTFSSVASGLTEEQILNEYRLQLQRLGEIVHEKTELISTSLTCFLVELIVFMAALAILIIAAKF